MGCSMDQGLQIPVTATVTVTILRCLSTRRTISVKRKQDQSGRKWKVSRNTSSHREPSNHNEQL
ncbi:hypothetical protein ASPCADRAFT_207017 [Aspergillus carbonarius ITEM 5010]|uniref:Uncharacterized protein n=1 Tax=Aspergillus carbonarius (strain ITEM 5010) TaxID=602072 RepID=A0A1R3RMB7_ASPC5|nr:hypothetical protein ASPCADRAFT_207017 [Aspergillus carbonarius ITEM 5010]